MRRPVEPSDPRKLARGAGRNRNLELRGPRPWRYVGDPEFCLFVTGRNMDPTPAVPDPMPLRIRWTLGAGLELQGDVSDVSTGDLICIFPPDYRLDHDVPVAGHDDQGNYVACRLYTTGHFVYGVA